MSSVNPYAPPKARLETPLDRAAQIGEFPRFSAWWVLLLTVATWNLYVPYWLLSRTRMLGRLSEDRIHALVVWTAFALVAASLLFSITDAMVHDSPAITVLSGVLSIAQWVGLLVWIFSFRNRFNVLMGSAPGDERWLGAVLTFFFHVIYMQYKINQAIDAGRLRKR